MKILEWNGQNLNMLGRREPDIYGKQTYQDLVEFIQRTADEENIQAECRQTNHEGTLVDWIQEAYGVFDGIVINPGAYTHTSIALLDAVKSVSIPTVEVHISDVSKREDFRQVSYIRSACVRTIMNLGFEGYRQAMLYLKKYNNDCFVKD